jgi:hypothetical protein
MVASDTDQVAHVRFAHRSSGQCLDQCRIELDVGERLAMFLQ